MDQKQHRMSSRPSLAQSGLSVLTPINSIGAGVAASQLRRKQSSIIMRNQSLSTCMHLASLFMCAGNSSSLSTLVLFAI